VLELPAIVVLTLLANCMSSFEWGVLSVDVEADVESDEFDAPGFDMLDCWDRELDADGREE